MRKEAKRYNVYANDYNFKVLSQPSNCFQFGLTLFFFLSLQVGAKCRVELQTENDRQMYTCHIQKIGTDKSYCVVFVENFGKEYLVGTYLLCFIWF